MVDEQVIAEFLAQHGLGDAPQSPLPSDASARRYIRLPGQDLLLMVDDTDPVGYAAFLKLATHLAQLGLSVPKVVAVDPENGLALIEDFGTATYGSLLKDGHDEAALYALAIDALVHLHRHPDAAALTVPAYDMDLLLKEISVFSDWFVPSFRPDVDKAQFDLQFRTLWAEAFAMLTNRLGALVLRDFHIDNLMLLPARNGVQRCGLLDFQDAVLGPAEYDLMSLLQDARRDLAPGLEAQMLARYLDAVSAGNGERQATMDRYYLLAAQRHTRLAGQFLRLHQRDGKPGYLQFMPRVMQQMTTGLADAKLTTIKAFLDETLPGWSETGEAFSKPA